MIDIIICSLTNAFRIYLIRKFILIFLNHNNKDENKVRELVVYGLFFVINTGLYLCFHISWVNMTCNLIGIYIFTCLYTKLIRIKMFITCAIYLISIGCDIIGTLLFVNYEEGEGFNQVFQIVIVFLVCVCVLSVEKIVSHKQDKNGVQSLPLMLIPLSSILMICILFYSSDDIKHNVIITICIGLLIINMLVFYLYNLILKTISDKYENEVLRQQLQIYSNQIDIILQSEERVKLLKHDLKHHINELKLLANKNEMHDMEEYINNMQVFIQNPNEIVDSGNVEIDGVLNYMLQKAKKELNTVNVKVQLPEKIAHSFDIVIVLSNLLENAIEAASKTQDRYLEVVIMYKQGVLRVETNNSFIVTEVLEDHNVKSGLATTKRDKEIHGIGLNSVQRIVEKYNGILDINYRGKLFCVKLMLYLCDTDIADTDSFLLKKSEHH